MYRVIKPIADVIVNEGYPELPSNRDLVGIDVFCNAKKVIDALQSRGVALDLAWCAENKTSLKKSKLHFDLSNAAWNDNPKAARTAR
ncbi:hypothetical protein C5167_044427 [Papaver somniferum]|uniref:Uncharacterized protein n=1 Tax=Papaver somniferum TaxID=3469 RepID=A0A4Y7LBH0_PAPSO|nr:hypothetical protein C5167_044427 [Papaver somniferum]